MQHQFIGQMDPGQKVNSIYLAKDPILRSTSRGDLYIAMYLTDATGQVNSRMWQATESAYRSLPRPGFIHVQGRSELYKNNLQIVINNFSVVEKEKVDIENFLPRTNKDTAQMFSETLEIVNQIQNSQLKALTQAFIDDKNLMQKFCQAPGGMKIHHSYLGGLLEHTLNMLKVATSIMPLYPEIQTDLVIAGIFLHDMGKTDELNYDIAFEYSDSGQLIGHITKTVVMVEKKAEELAKNSHPIDADVLNPLLHIILSHHGEYEFGSPKLPATAEAFVVNYIDNLDARINHVTSAINAEQSDANWTQWQKALGTRLYRKPIE